MYCTEGKIVHGDGSFVDRAVEPGTFRCTAWTLRGMGSYTVNARDALADLAPALRENRREASRERARMDYLGLFCLGAFVGTIATFGMGKVVSLKDWQTVLSLTLPAVLSGAASSVFIDRFKYSPAFGCYPLGLVAALLWAYTQKSIDNLKAGPTSVRILALLHLFAAALLTGAGAFVATVPAVLQLRAEWEVPMDERVEEMRLLRSAAREQPPSAGRSTGRARGVAAASAPASASR